MIVDPKSHPVKDAQIENKMGKKKMVPQIINQPISFIPLPWNLQKSISQANLHPKWTLAP